MKGGSVYNRNDPKINYDIKINFRNYTMNLFTLLNNKPKPITVGIIGAGKFATMFFAQALKIPSIHIVGVVDLYPENAKSNMEMVG